MSKRISSFIFATGKHLQVPIAMYWLSAYNAGGDLSEKWILWSSSSRIKLLPCNAVFGIMAVTQWSKNICDRSRSCLTTVFGPCTEQGRLEIWNLIGRKQMMACSFVWHPAALIFHPGALSLFQTAGATVFDDEMSPAFPSLTCVTSIINRHYHHHWCTQFDG